MTVAERPVEPLHRRLGVTDDELDAIRDRLGGRDPNDLELAMFSVMWSEHCSYKSSKPLLRTLPTAGEGVVAGPGENAGVISIGDGLAVAFKIESHNHPSAVEPYQGAATGVGGILRDIFTMGARPIAVLDALRFGDPADARTRHLVDGVVRGVGGYGNCVGVPTVGGELVFDPSLRRQPAGQRHGHRPARGAAADAGRGARTRQPRRPVRLGDRARRDRRRVRPRQRDVHRRRPVEAAVGPGRRPVRREAAHRGEPRAHRAAASSRASRTSAPAASPARRPRPPTGRGPGILVDLDAIPRREPGLEPFEVMISESQERMCAAVLPERWPDVREVCERWGLPVAIIGRVTADGDIAIVEGGLDAGRPAEPGRPRDRPRPGRALTSDAIVHERVAAAPTHRRGAPGAGRAGAPSATACRSAGWTRAPSCSPCSGRRTCLRATRSSTSTTRPSAPTRSPGRVAAPPSCG